MIKYKKSGNIENQIAVGGNIENRSASDSEPEYGDGIMRDKKINDEKTDDRKRADGTNTNSASKNAAGDGTNDVGLTVDGPTEDSSTGNGQTVESTFGSGLCLTSPADISRIMKRYGFAFSRSLGQNFLIDSHAVDSIIGAVEKCILRSEEGLTNDSSSGLERRSAAGLKRRDPDGAGNRSEGARSCCAEEMGSYSAEHSAEGRINRGTGPLLKHPGCCSGDSFGNDAKSDSTICLPAGDSQGERGHVAGGRFGDVLIIEIGPGFGVLTERLCELAAHVGTKVVAIEKDKSLPPILRELVPAANLEIISEDVLACDLDAMIRDAGCERAVVVANLPYYITTPIIMKVLEDARRVDALVVMMQKEVADRILDRGDRGAITMTAGYYAERRQVASIKRNSFMPAPKVDSAVLSMTRIPPRTGKKEEKMYMRLVRAIYSSRRKTLINSLNSLNLCDKKRLSDVIIHSGYSPLVRGETLGIEDLLILSKEFTALEER